MFRNESSIQLYFYMDIIWNPVKTFAVKTVAKYALNTAWFCSMNCAITMDADDAIIWIMC